MRQLPAAITRASPSCAISSAEMMTALLKAATSLPPPSNLRSRSNEPDAWQTKYRGGFSEERDAEYHGSDCTDAGPHRICGPKWKGAQRQAQQYHALDQRNGRCDRRPELSKPVRVLESHGPADFEKPCQEQNGPRNVIASAGRVPCPSIQTIVSKGESLGKTNTRGSDQEPHRGCVNCGHHRFEIVDMDGNRVDRVLAMRVRKRTRCALSRSFPLV